MHVNALEICPAHGSPVFGENMARKNQLGNATINWVCPSSERSKTSSGVHQTGQWPADATQQEHLRHDVKVGNQLPVHLQWAPEEGGAWRWALQTVPHGQGKEHTATSMLQVRMSPSPVEPKQCRAPSITVSLCTHLTSIQRTNGLGIVCPGLFYRDKQLLCSVTCANATPARWFRSPL